MAIVASGSATLVDLNDSKQLVVYIGSSQQKTVIYNPNDSSYTPNYSTSNQVLTPQVFIAGTNTDVASSAKSIRWFYQTNSAGALTEITVNGGGYTLAGTGVKTLTISSNVLASNTSMTYVCEVVYTDPDTGFDVTAKADIELVKVTNGQKGDAGINAITAFLTNASVALPASNAGAVSSYNNSGTDVYVYEGSTALQYDGTGTANGTFKVVATGSGITPATPTDGGAFASYGNASGLANGTDTAKITYVITGKQSNGTAINITLVQTFSKSKVGLDGTTPTSYWMTLSSPVIQKNVSNAYNPTTITATGFSQTGTGTPSSTAIFKFRIDTDTGSGFVNGTPDATAVASKAYTGFPANLKAVRFRMYQSSVTPSDTNFIDEQIVMVVSDGATGQDAVVSTISTPDGNVIKNSSGTLTAKVTLYKGTTEVTASAYKWYIQDPTATVASGGDADGGDGWRLLNATYNAGTTGYDGDTLTIPATAIASVESFKCVATYGSGKYKDVCTVIDVTDPILVTIVGINTFKNGQGSTSLTAKLYRNGAEIDTDGTGYTYTWSLYNQLNVKTAFTATGKTITVNASDIDVRGNIICEVSK